MAEDDMRFEYNGAECFDIKVPYIGSARAVICDLLALRRCIEYCKERPQIKKPVFYVLACRIGPFIEGFRREIHELGGILMVNPDGHEWKRAKWSAPVRRYWKMSEGLMVKSADVLICDSKNIEKYIRKTYRKQVPETKFIAYGSEIEKSPLADDDPRFVQWLDSHGLKKKEYYLVVGRFVPENNFETMIREFMASDSTKDFAIITTTDGRFYNRLQESLHFENDSRIKFVGTVYDQDLLKKIRENAYANFHGHEVGGTNPSLLEALGATELNLLLGVGFNREVAEEAALYWSKETGNLAALIHKADRMSPEEIGQYGELARGRVREHYSWDKIVTEYEDVFLTKAAE
jgi:rhamnosyltransferase